MNLISCYLPLLAVVLVSALHAAPPGNKQQLTSPDQTPEGLEKSDWASIRAAIDPIAQQAYLKASNTGADDYFGHSVAVSGDTVVVGARLEASNATGVNGNQANNSTSQAGAAYVFTRSGTTWAQQAYLKASNTGVQDQFGYSVAVSGDTVVIGAYGESSNATGVNGDQDDNSAFAAGAAYIFTRSGTTWTQQAYLKASNAGAGDRFGWSVSVSGDTVVVGAYGESSNASNQADNSAGSAGAAYVFTRSGTTWTQQAYLKASNAGAADRFGWSVAASGDTMVVGAYGESSNATGVNGDQANNSASNSGAAYVFTRSGTTWTQQAYLKASNTGASDWFGYSVAVSGDSVFVGALDEDSNGTGVNGNQANNLAATSGAAYVFTRSGTTWTQQAYLKASNTGGGDEFGHSVAVSGDTAVVGARGEDSNATGVDGNQADNSAFSSGATYVFTRSGTTWTQQAYLKASNAGVDDNFGFSVAVSGDTVVLGAWSEDSNATGVDGNQANNSASASGAAYIFTGLDSSPPSGGMMTLTPAFPLDASAALTVAFANWTDPSLPLSYTVLIDDVVVSPAGASASRNFTGPATPGGHTLRGRITDGLGNLTEVTQPFTVLTAQESWRRTYFGITTNTGLAADTADPDGDGEDNLFEFVAGLVPTDPVSRFVLRIEAVAGQPTRRAIIFSPRLADRTYVVKYKAGLNDPTWTPVAASSTSDNGSQRTVIDLSATPPRFYQVEITQP